MVQTPKHQAPHKYRKPQRAVAEAPTSSFLNGLDSAVGYANSAAGMVAMGLGLGGQMVVPAAAGIASFAGAKGFSESLMRPIEFLNHTTVSDAAARIPKGVTAGVKKTSDMLAGAASVPLGVASKVPGLGALKAENVKSIPKQIGQSSLMHATLTGAFISMAALQVYGVTREFSGLVQALRELEADLTGKDVNSISTAAVLTGNVSKPVEEARALIFKTSGSHMLAAAANLGVNVGMAFSNRLGPIVQMLMYSAPEVLGSLAEGVFGQSPLPVYSGLRKAFNEGQEITAEAYAEFLIAGSDKLRNRGRTGRQFAAELGAQYAAEHTSPADVLLEISNGKMQARVDALTAADKKEQSKGETPASFAEREAMRKQNTLARLAKDPKHSLPRHEPVGAFTEQLNKEAAAKSDAPSIG